jgi:hypothetical protein
MIFGSKLPRPDAAPPRRILLPLAAAVLATLLSSFSWAAEPICPGGSSPDPNVVFCDDFNDGSWLSSPTWAASNNHDGSEGVKCGGFGYSDDCAAYTGDQMFFDGNYGYDDHYAEYALPREFNEGYVRLYVQFSDNFSWGNVSDKGIYLFGSGRNWNMKIEYNQWGNGMAGFASYATPGERRGQNQGNDLQWEPGKWYLVEIYVKVNDPGAANGIVKVWIDDASSPVGGQTLRLSYGDLTLREAGQGNGFSEIGLHEYHNGCDQGGSCPASIPQWVKWDNIAFSGSPIGPAGQAGVPTRKKPKSPRNVTLR